MLSIRLPNDLEERLNRISKTTNKPKSFIVKEALGRYLTDIEDYHCALERLSQPHAQYYTTEEIKKELD